MVFGNITADGPGKSSRDSPAGQNGIQGLTKIAAGGFHPALAEIGHAIIDSTAIKQFSRGG
jgi:hypothetical protein